MSLAIINVLCFLTGLEFVNLPQWKVVINFTSPNRLIWKFQTRPNLFPRIPGTFPPRKWWIQASGLSKHLALGSKYKSNIQTASFREEKVHLIMQPLTRNEPNSQEPFLLSSFLIPLSISANYKFVFVWCVPILCLTFRLGRISREIRDSDFTCVCVCVLVINFPFKLPGFATFEISSHYNAGPWRTSGRVIDYHLGHFRSHNPRGWWKLSRKYKPQT